MKLVCIELLGLLMVFLLLGCKEEYPVEKCNEGQGLDLETQGVPFFGEETSPIDVTMFMDFQCPPSANMAFHILALMDQLHVDGLDGYLKLHIRHFPSSNHNRARAAAKAAAAAHLQGEDAFRKIFPHLFKFNDADLTDDKILLYADLADLDLELFSVDFGSEEVAHVVDRDFELGVEIGLDATPGVVICGIEVNGTPEEIVDNLEYLVEGEL